MPHKRLLPARTAVLHYDMLVRSQEATRLGNRNRHGPYGGHEKLRSSKFRKLQYMQSVYSFVSRQRMFKTEKLCRGHDAAKERTSRKLQYMRSIYCAPLGRPELPEVYMRCSSGFSG